LLLIGLWGAVVYLIVYNLTHFSVRIKGLIDSYSKGFDIVRDLSLRGAQKYFRILKYAFSSLLAIEIVIVISKIIHTPFSWSGSFVFVISMLISFFIMRRQKITIDLLIVIVVCSSIIIGLII